MRFSNIDVRYVAFRTDWQRSYGWSWNPRPPQTPLAPVDYDRRPASTSTPRAAPCRRRPSSTTWTSSPRHLPARRPLTSHRPGLRHGAVHAGAGRGVRRPGLWRRARRGDAPDRGGRRALIRGSATWPGEAAAIPLPGRHAPTPLLMFLSFHHFPDQAAAAREIARVMKPRRGVHPAQHLRGPHPRPLVARLLPAQPGRSRRRCSPSQRRGPRRCSRRPASRTVEVVHAGDPVRGRHRRSGRAAAPARGLHLRAPDRGRNSTRASPASTRRWPPGRSRRSRPSAISSSSNASPASPERPIAHVNCRPDAPPSPLATARLGRV